MPAARRRSASLSSSRWFSFRRLVMVSRAYKNGHLLLSLVFISRPKGDEVGEKAKRGHLRLRLRGGSASNLRLRYWVLGTAAAYSAPKRALTTTEIERKEREGSTSSHTCVATQAPVLTDSSQHRCIISTHASLVCILFRSYLNVPAALHSMTENPNFKSVTLGAAMENPSTEMSVDPSSAAVISPPPPPPPPGLMDRLKAVRPWCDLVSAAVRAASLSSIFLTSSGE